MTMPSSSPAGAATGTSLYPQVNRAAVFEAIGERWALEILLFFGDDPVRFNQLLVAIPKISPSMLSRRLRDLERVQLLVRRRIPGAVKPAYFLGPQFSGLRPVLDKLSRWRAGSDGRDGHPSDDSGT